MKKTYSFLIIEDHPLISGSYLDALHSVESKNENLSFEKIGIAENCDEALEVIQKVSKSKGVDIVFLDIQLPPSRDGKILSGEDLGILIRKTLPKSKIIVSTMFNDNYRVYNIMNTIIPDGFLVKNDLNPIVLEEAINKIIDDTPFYTTTVMQFVQRQMAIREVIDEFDRKMLYELSRGTKMKDLPGMIPLSLAALEKRKRRLKEIFNVEQMEDRFLILATKKKGFI